MATVTYDGRSFMLDNQRVWLVSGSVHYFRSPRQLWPDLLLKAKRAGLNCIDTYVPWNLHEPVEGKWDFTGDKDVAAFIELADDMGLYVILRPGPYICAEWDFGGLPAWLTTKPGITYRTNSASYTHYYDKFFRQILPRLADMQVTRDGNIILIQNENEYYMTAMPERLAYLEFISQLFRRSGFDIPIITCNCLTDPTVPDTIDCVNQYDRIPHEIKRMRLRQPNAPLLVTEFWPGWFDAWGSEHQRRDARQVARKAMEILGCGAQCNYYMFHGGTNFEFWGSRLNMSDRTYQTASYDLDAPLAEGGGLTRKYYLTRLVNVLANSMGQSFANCSMEDSGVSILDASSVLGISGPAWSWTVITNGGRDEIQSVSIALPAGKKLNVSLELFGASIVPMKVPLGATAHTLDYCNLMPLGFFGDKVLVLHGPPDWQGRVSIDGVELALTVPSANEPHMVEYQGIQIAVVNHELATRTWPMEDSLVFGPKYVGQTIEDAVYDAMPVTVLSFAAGLSHNKVKPSPKPPTAPKLGPWKRQGVCIEPVSHDLVWHKLDRPRHVDQIGVHYGYVWYRAEFNEPAAIKRMAFLPQCEDRATIYLNGSRVGVWGRGEDAFRQPMPINFHRGANVLTMLLDNMGRTNYGPRLGELKGIWGHMYDAKPLKLPKPKFGKYDAFNRRMVPRGHAHIMAELESLPIWCLQLQISLPAVAPIHVAYTDLYRHVAILCNDRLAQFMSKEGGGFDDVTLGSELKKGANNIKILVWGDADAGILNKFSFNLLAHNITQDAKWSYRPWTAPKAGDHIVGKDQPAWYVSNFNYTPTPCPLFVRVNGAKKGQLFINGHNAGRFWNIGPQEYYHLPAPWLAQHNELVLFEEQGLIPSNSRVEFRPGGPYHEE